MSAVDVGSLRGVVAAIAAATAGPWEADEVRNEADYGDGGPDSKTGFHSYAIFGPQGMALMDSINSEIIMVEEDADDEGDRYAWDEVARKNAAAIVAAVNWLRENGEALAAQLEAHKALVEAAEEVESVLARLYTGEYVGEDAINLALFGLEELRPALAPFRTGEGR